MVISLCNMELNKIYNEDCLSGMSRRHNPEVIVRTSALGMNRILDESVDVICTDPPWKYLKNQKLDVDFNEDIFFHECKRILKKDGFIILFGRGTSFYRWNTILADLGFAFKEEFIWNKCYSTSPLMSISRVHETISIHTKGDGIFNKVKVPYLEMKKYDIKGMVTDINRLKTTFQNTKSLNNVLAFLKNNENNDDYNNRIRTDMYESKKFTKFGLTGDERKSADRQVTVMNAMYYGMNEKTIITQRRDHYETIHPTQKPVKLLKRLLALVSKPGDTCCDTFSGSGSTAEACIEIGINFIAFEKEKEFYDPSVERINKKMKTPKLFETEF